jgi:hypothetical protein
MDDFMASSAFFRNPCPLGLTMIREWQLSFGRKICYQWQNQCVNPEGSAGAEQKQRQRVE